MLPSLRRLFGRKWNESIPLEQQERLGVTFTQNMDDGGLLIATALSAETILGVLTANGNYYETRLPGNGDLFSKQFVKRGVSGDLPILVDMCVKALQSGPQFVTSKQGVPQLKLMYSLGESSLPAEWDLDLVQTGLTRQFVTSFMTHFRERSPVLGEKVPPESEHSVLYKDGKEADETSAGASITSPGKSGAVSKLKKRGHGASQQQSFKRPADRPMGARLKIQKPSEA